MKVAAALLILVGAALAGETDSMPSRVGVSLAQTRLTLQQAIEMALASNLDIEIEKSNLAAAEQAVRGSHGFYDPRLRWAPSLVSENDPSPSVLQGVMETEPARTLGEFRFLAEPAVAGRFGGSDVRQQPCVGDESVSLA